MEKVVPSVEGNVVGLAQGRDPLAVQDVQVALGLPVLHTTGRARPQGSNRSPVLEGLGCNSEWGHGRDAEICVPAYPAAEQGS